MAKPPIKVTTPDNNKPPSTSPHKAPDQTFPIKQMAKALFVCLTIICRVQIEPRTNRQRTRHPRTLGPLIRSLLLRIFHRSDSAPDFPEDMLI